MKRPGKIRPGQTCESFQDEDDGEETDNLDDHLDHSETPEEADRNEGGEVPQDQVPQDQVPQDQVPQQQDQSPRESQTPPKKRGRPRVSRPTHLPQGEDIYEPERIMQQRKRNGRVEYFIKWKGYPHSQNSWEPLEHLLGDNRLLEDFERRRGR